MDPDRGIGAGGAPGLRRAAAGLFLALALGALAGCAGSRPPGGAPDPRGREETGVASFYADRFHGRRTASGERFDQSAMTAAHRTLPFGTRVRVTNLGNGRRVVVRITDRGPAKRERVIDLSKAAARELRFVGAGLARVRLEVLPSGLAAEDR